MIILLLKFLIAVNNTQIMRYLFLIFFSFIQISSYAKSNFLYELISKTKIASTRSEYLQQQEEASSKAQCFEDKMRSSYVDTGRFAIIVYENRIDVWNNQCELYGSYFMGTKYIKVRQDYSHYKLPELKYCKDKNSSSDVVTERTFYWEGTDGVVMYRRAISGKDLTPKQELQRHPLTWELRHMFIDLYPKSYFISKCL